MENRSLNQILLLITIALLLRDRCGVLHRFPEDNPGIRQWVGSGIRERGPGGPDRFRQHGRPRQAPRIRDKTGMSGGVPLRSRIKAWLSTFITVIQATSAP